MKRVSIRFFTLLLCMSLGPLAAADELLRNDHPDRYTVVKGDTLWDISGRFLRSPWRWPDIWHVNPQIGNPHLIYPGDVLELVYVDGKPRLQLQRGPRKVKLSPQARSTPWSGTIPTIPIDAIAPFLTKPYVIDEDAAKNSPYIVDFADDHIVGGAGQRAYVRSIDDATGKYDVVRPGGPYKDGDTGEILGYEAVYVGTSTVQRTGDPATIFFNSTEIEAVIGDRVIPAAAERATVNFTPHAPEQDVRGNIISVLNGVSQIGQYNVVVLDRGEQEGLKPGTVLQIDQRGETVRDVVTPDSRDTVTLPDEKAGLLMVFRTFDRVAFGLVLHATKAMHVGDRVHNP